MKPIPLNMKGVNNTADDVITANLEATFKRGYKPFVEVKEYKGPVSIVGAGPSLSWTYKDIVGDVIACNSAHDFLISKGVIPKYTMLWDAHPIMNKVIEKPHKDVKYLIASRCHPGVFEKFKDYDVTVWHAMGGDSVEKFLAGRMEPMIPGGSSSVMRATHVAGALGYTKEMHLFGIDSSYTEGRSHVGSHVASNELELRACGKWFTVAPWMAVQAGDFKILAPMFQASGVRLVVHGTGLIPYVATFLGIETPDIRVNLYEKIRREVHGFMLQFSELKNSPQLLGGSNARI